MATIPLADIRKLSVAERIQLAEDIWDSIVESSEAGGSTDLPITEVQKQELEERLAEADAHPGVGKSWDDVKARLLGRA